MSPKHGSSPALTRSRSRSIGHGGNTPNPMSAAFGFGLTAAWFAIGILWIITPLCYAYVLYTMITELTPSLSKTASPTAISSSSHHRGLLIVHYIFLSYCALEIPFSIYYKYLTYKANKIRPPPNYTRKFLRDVFKKSLENGLKSEEGMANYGFECESDGNQSEEGDVDPLEALTSAHLSPGTTGENGNVNQKKKKKNEEAAGNGNDSIKPRRSIRSIVLRQKNQQEEDEEKQHRTTLSGPGRNSFEMRQRRKSSSKNARPHLNELTEEPESGLPSPMDTPTLLKGNGGFDLSREPTFNTSKESLATTSASTVTRGEENENKVDIHQVENGDTLEENTPRTEYPSRPKPRYAPSFLPNRRSLHPEDPRASDFRDFLRLWFLNSRWEDIRRDNISEWLSWSLYGQSYEEIIQERKDWEDQGRPPIMHDETGELDSDDVEGLEIDADKLGLVEHCIEMIEARSARGFPKGKNPNAKAIRLTLDPVRVIGRPIILYGFVTAVQAIMKTIVKSKGFQEHQDGETRYLIKIPADWQPSSCDFADGPESRRPLLFIHGLGMGLPQYATLVSYLGSNKDLRRRPIIILLQPHISMSFFAKGYLKPPSKETLADDFLLIAKRWNFQKSGFTILSHSNGTIVHGWLLKAHPELIVRSCFVDPVCFCLWEPYVCFNFLYSKARTPIEYLMRYFVSRELGVANMLQRAFDWSTNLLLPTHIPNLLSPYHTAFYLAGKDSIINTERVRKYLVLHHDVRQVAKGENIDEHHGGLKVYAHKKHGESMIGEGKAFEQIMAWCKCERGNDANWSSSGSGAESS